MSSVRSPHRTRNFCKRKVVFCRVQVISVSSSSVRQSYPYPELRQVMYAHGTMPGVRVWHEKNTPVRVRVRVYHRYNRKLLLCWFKHGLRIYVSYTRRLVPGTAGKRRDTEQTYGIPWYNIPAHLVQSTGVKGGMNLRESERAGRAGLACLWCATKTTANCKPPFDVYRIVHVLLLYL